MSTNLKKMAFILAGIFFIVGVFTLPDYGINWDTINHLPRGQAYLHYFLTGQKDYKDLPTNKAYWQKPENLFIDASIPKNESMKRSYYQIDGMNFIWWQQYDGVGHPPLSDILSSFFNYILFTKLGLINDIDAYRIYAIFLAASLVGLIFFWISGIYGKFAGFISSLSLALYPLFWSEAHFNNEKDIPETVFWSFFIFFIWKGLISKNWKLILVSGIFLGLAMGTKFNILFVPFVILPWVITLIFFRYIKLKFNLFNTLIQNWRILTSVVAVPLIGFTIFFVSWPYLWTDPINHLREVVGFYKNIGITRNINTDFVGPLGINTYPLQWIIYTTPLVVLILALVGIGTSIFTFIKEKNKNSLLFLLWLIVPITRVTLPKTTIYGGIRQIMEYIPAMAIFAGIGAMYLRHWLELFFVKIHLPKFLATFFLVLAFLPILFKLISIHPNENVYFNVLIKGLSGAKERQIPSWGNSFGAAYRQGLVWLNEHAEKDNKVALAYELMPNIPRLWFRPDLNFSNTYRSGYLRRGEYTIGLMYEGVEGRSYYDNYLEKFINPVYEAKVDNIPVLKIWKNDEAHLKNSWKEAEAKNILMKTTSDGLHFDLGQVIQPSRLEIDYLETGCLPMKSMEVKLSVDGKNWEILPEKLPTAWTVAVSGPQPANGKFIEPFVGQDARYIELLMEPENTCLMQVRGFKLYRFI